MRLFKFAMAGAITVSMVAATGAIAAAPSRSAAAIPNVQNAPVSGLRTATPLKRKSNQSDGNSQALGYGLAAVVGAGIIAGTVAAVNDNSHHRPASPG